MERVVGEVFMACGLNVRGRLCWSRTGKVIQSALGCCEGTNSEENTHSGEPAGQTWGWDVYLREHDEAVLTSRRSTWA
jgi:hypothetical protein